MIKLPPINGNTNEHSKYRCDFFLDDMIGVEEGHIVNVSIANTITNNADTAGEKLSLVLDSIVIQDGLNNNT